jgi:hypothetical protein
MQRSLMEKHARFGFLLHSRFHAIQEGNAKNTSTSIRMTTTRNNQVPVVILGVFEVK